MLGRKQLINNQMWLDTVANIESLVSEGEIRCLEEKTVGEIVDTVTDKNAAYAWSGGKDSIVLSSLCRQAGINKCMMAVCDLEYPSFMEWVETHKPDGLTIINTGHGIEWLAKHLEALFPPMTYHWSRFIQIAAQNEYYHERCLEMLILGRRKADGNFVGKGTNLYTDGKHRTKYNPIADWTHEQVLAYIHYNQLPMPPFYQWENGYKIGTHPWFARPYINDVQEGWKQIYQIDRRIVEYAAPYIDSAKLFLEGVR